MPIGGEATLGGSGIIYNIPKKFQDSLNPGLVGASKQPTQGERYASGPSRGRIKPFIRKPGIHPSKLSKKAKKKYKITVSQKGSPQKLRSILSGGAASPSSVLGG
jgi:hypothetical protein